MIIGIDSGSSAVKIIAQNEERQIIHKLMINKMPIMKALEIFINKEKTKTNEISKIVLTGVGKDEIKGNIYDIPTIKVDEFVAIGTGGLYLANQKKALVVSIGTGTAFVIAEGKRFKHIGGTGVGGGTLLNLCKKFGSIETFPEINEAIKKASLKNIDLRIEDATTTEIKTLPKDTTLSNFGKLNENASKEDLILGFVNMALETIGVMAVFAAKNNAKKNIIITGNVATMPYINTVLKRIEKLHKDVKFIIPKQAEYATIIGAIKALE